MKLRGYHTPSLMVIIPADTLSSATHQWAEDTPTKIQKVLKKISQSAGGSTPHVVQIAHAWGGGGQYICTYMRANESKRMSQMFFLEKISLDSREIHTKFIRISCEFRENFTMPQYSHTFVHVKFARNSYEFRTNSVRISLDSHEI